MKPIEKFEKDDIKNLRELFAVITSSDYKIQGNALEKAGALFTWYRSLEKKIDGALKRQLIEEISDKEPKIRAIENVGDKCQ